MYTARILEKKNNFSVNVLNAGNETHDADSGDINKLLFSAIVQSNWFAISRIVDVADAKLLGFH